MPETLYEMMKKFPLAPHHEVRETFADKLAVTAFDANILRLDLAVGRMEEPTPPKGERHIVCGLVLTMNCAVDLINQLNHLGTQLAQTG